MRTRSVALGMVLAVGLGAPLLRCAEDKPPVPPAPEASTTALTPSGMVRVPGGKVKLGMTRTALNELIKTTVLGRKANQERGIEAEYSLSCPEYEVELPPYWLQKYEFTNAQWKPFLDAHKVVIVVPEKGKPGPNTLEQIARLHLLADPFPIGGGVHYYPVANEWKAIYELNEEVLNPVVKDQDPKTRPAPETFRDRVLPPGTKIVTYRWSVPLTWRVKGKLQASPPPGMEEMPVTTVSLADAEACALHFGCHVPTEPQWEAACRGPKGEFWPEGGIEVEEVIDKKPMKFLAMDPLAHNWAGFNDALLKVQEGAGKKLEAAEKALADARAKGIPAEVARAEAVRNRLKFIFGAREIPQDPPYTIVGMFPLGVSPCGAMDLVGNVEEWVSTPLFPYPRTDSKSDYRDADACVLRGGNALDMDSLLTATYRKFKTGDVLLGRHFKAASAGFRVARYEAPGASAASTVERHLYGQDGRVPILPREELLKPRRIVGPRLDIGQAAGMARYNEVPWNPEGSPRNDPPGKVYYLGAAESFCIVPADGMPFREVNAIKDGAQKNPVPPRDAKDHVETRQPRDIPFFGVLHMSAAVKVKGIVRVVKEVDVPLTDADRKKIKEDWDREKKAQAEKKKKEEEEEKKKDGGAGGIQQALEGGSKKDDKKKKKDEEKPAEEAPAEEEGDEDKPDEEKGPVYPKTKKETKETYEPGAIEGLKAPHGLLLGLLRHGEETRAVLWEARQSPLTTTPPAHCRTVMLEPPLVVLDKDCMTFKKVGKAGEPSTEILDEALQVLKVVFYVPIEGKEGSGCFEVTLTLKLDFTQATPGRPWVTMPPKTKPK
jgi:formylglycine-generating enzyme required for sulfatase activity